MSPGLRVGSPQQFDAYIKSEISKWAAIVKNSGMPLQ
jgi:tripartite-type tricarboxylate transporter receptor subunit TctC